MINTGSPFDDNMSNLNIGDTIHTSDGDEYEIVNIRMNGLDIQLNDKSGLSYKSITYIRWNDFNKMVSEGYFLINNND